LREIVDTVAFIFYVQSMMKENGITNVLNVSCKCAKPPHVDERRFRRIPVRDNYQEKITPHLDEAVSFIGKFEILTVMCLSEIVLTFSEMVSNFALW